MLLNNFNNSKTLLCFQELMLITVIALVDNQQHSHDVISMLSMNNICIRAGHHCAQPLLNALGMSHCLRISIALYNDKTISMH